MPMPSIPVRLLLLILIVHSVRAASEKKEASDQAGIVHGDANAPRPSKFQQFGGGMGGGNLLPPAETVQVKARKQTAPQQQQPQQQQQQQPVQNLPDGSGSLTQPKLPVFNICDLLKYPEKFLNATENFVGGLPSLVGENGTGLLSLDILKELSLRGLLGNLGINGSGILGLPGLKDVLGAGRGLLDLVPGLGLKMPEMCKSAEECKFKDNGCMFKKTLGVKMGTCQPCSEKDKYQGSDKSVDGCGLEFLEIMLLVGLAFLCILTLILLTIIICMCISPCKLFKWRLLKYNTRGSGRDVGPAPTPKYQSNTSMDMKSDDRSHHSSGAKADTKYER